LSYFLSSDRFLAWWKSNKCSFRRTWTSNSDHKCWWENPP